MNDALIGIIITALLGIIGILLKIAIINPINEWPKQLEEIKKNCQTENSCLAVVESSTRLAHHRIDGLEERVSSLERR